MCGIAGIVWKHAETQRAPAFRSATRVMLRAMHHRGPDGEGFVDASWFSLGHARLSIVDLEFGSQPMTTNDGGLHLVANGEIYNHEDIRARLSNSAEFRTKSDCEAILHTYATEGVSGLDRLNGMYAAAIADRNQEHICLAIDPIGIKPLYTFECAEYILFSSELRGIIAGLHHLGAQPRLNLRGCRRYLRQGWFSEDDCLIDGAARLRPGSRWFINRQLSVRRFEPGSSKIASDDTRAPSEQELESNLGDALERQMMSDVPVGFFLSGGIDSSLLVALARKRGIDATTFTVDFVGSAESERVSEGAVARRVARELGCDHHELRMAPGDLLAELDSALSSLDEPLADPAVLPLLQVCRFARQKVKVCLSGDGGDELFSGYFRHRIEWFKRHLAGRPNLAGAVKRAGDVLLRSGETNHASGWIYKAAILMDMLSNDDFVYGPFSGRYSKYLEAEGGRNESITSVPSSGGHTFFRELEAPLSGQMLTKTDRSSMWASLEVRVPYLDLEFVATAIRIPERKNAGLRSGKRPLREILSRHLPRAVSARSKHGFRVPISSWMRNELRSELSDELRDGNLIPRELIRKESIDTILRLHVSGVEEHSIRLWSILCLNRTIARLQR